MIFGCLYWLDIHVSLPYISNLKNHNTVYSVSFGIEVSGTFSTIDDVVMSFFGMDLIASKFKSLITLT